MHSAWSRQVLSYSEHALDRLELNAFSINIGILTVQLQLTSWQIYQSFILNAPFCKQYAESNAARQACSDTMRERIQHQLCVNSACRLKKLLLRLRSSDLTYGGFEPSQ